VGGSSEGGSKGSNNETELGRLEAGGWLGVGKVANRDLRWFVVLVRIHHHHGIPVVVPPFDNVDNTWQHGDLSQATKAHLRFDFGLSTVAFSAYIWG